MRNKTLKRYTEYNGDTYLELHDNHTIWELDNSKATDEDFIWLVNDAIDLFKRDTGVQVFLLGRSGRHVCVKDTADNSRRYQYLRNKALQLEEKVVRAFNSI